jgi:hypothetical protein
MSANFPFQENIDVFGGEKTDKEYWLKISSKDATAISPFDFTVKFDMNASNSNNPNSTFKYNKEANIGSKYNQIKRLEVTDIVVPRYIPTTTIGLNFDGVSLVQIDSSANLYTVSLYPGVTQKLGPNYMKLCNPKETVIVTDISNSLIYLDDTSGSSFRYKDYKIIDHVNINNIVYPILNVTGNIITIGNLTRTLPATFKFVMGNYYSNLLYATTSTSYTLTNTSIKINRAPASIFENIYSGNILRVTDASRNYYFTYASQSTDTSGNVTLVGSWVNVVNPTVSGTVSTYLFGFGTRDLIDQRIFYLELDPFVPVKSSATDNNLDKMFGVLFPSTQSREWAYLSGEPREVFLPRDLRNLNKITVRIYDSDGVSLNDIFLKRPNLLSSNYYPNMYTTMIIKVDEIDKSLVGKKLEDRTK